MDWGGDTASIHDSVEDENILESDLKDGVKLADAEILHLPLLGTVTTVF